MKRKLQQKHIQKSNKRMITVGNMHLDQNTFFIIAGPCVIENEKLTLQIAEEVKKIAERCSVPFIFKSSYDKGNRTTVGNYRGPGIKNGLKILKKVKQLFDVPILSDVQCKEEVQEAASVLDVIQIPAYLSQQTDLTVAVARTGRVVNIKKGQFLSPWDVTKIISKVESTGNNSIILTERGTVFGYNNLVVDMRGFEIMREAGYPIVFDVTHAIRIPGIPSSEGQGGQPKFILPLARASIGAGANALFIETHPNPPSALCDAASMLPLSSLYEVIEQARSIFDIVKNEK